MKIAGAYVRKSKEDERGGGADSALQTQRDAIARIAEAEGARIEAWFEDDGVSGRAESRVGLDAMLARCREGSVDVVYIYDRSRWARNVKLGAGLDEELERLGIELRDRTPSTGDPDADWMRRRQEDIANEWHIRLTSRKTREGKRRIFEDGLPAGNVAVGYRSVHEERGLRRLRVAVEVDPVRAPVVQDGFRLYATEGYSFLDLAEWAEGLGFTMPRTGLPPARETWGDILANPQYAGWQMRDGQRVRTAYPPLVSDDLFARVQSVRRRRRQGGSRNRRRKHDYPLRGLLRCCDKHRLEGFTKAANKAGHKHRYYRHPRRRSGKRAQECGGNSIRADVVESAVHAFLAGFRPEPATLQMALELWCQRRSDRADRDQRLARLRERRSRLSQQHEMGLVSGPELRERLAVLDLDEATLRAEPQTVDIHTAAQVLADFARLMERASPKELERLYQMVFEEIVVEAHDRVVVVAKPEFAPLLAAHGVRLDSTGRAMVAPTGFEPVLPA